MRNKFRSSLYFYLENEFKKNLPDIGGYDNIVEIKHIIENYIDNCCKVPKVKTKNRVIKNVLQHLKTYKLPNDLKKLELVLGLIEDRIRCCIN